ncbi:hypothetical protein OSI78_25710, partial [Mycobacterium ulcerans]
MNAPIQAATGRPLIGNGTPGDAGSGTDGTPGGWLLGDGGRRRIRWHRPRRRRWRGRRADG